MSYIFVKNKMNYKDSIMPKKNEIILLKDLQTLCCVFNYTQKDYKIVRKEYSSKFYWTHYSKTTKQKMNEFISLQVKSLTIC